MGLQDLKTTYHRLRGELEVAYAAPVWNSQQIDRIADEIVRIERALTNCARERTFAVKSSGMRRGDVLVG